jgi:hypothetical protein
MGHGRTSVCMRASVLQGVGLPQAGTRDNPTIGCVGALSASALAKVYGRLVKAFRRAPTWSLSAAIMALKSLRW